MKKDSVTARIKCEVEIEVGTWTRSATFYELADTVRSEGLQALTKIMRDNGGRVVGTPVILFVMAEEAQ